MAFGEFDKCHHQPDEDGGDPHPPKFYPGCFAVSSPHWLPQAISDLISTSEMLADFY